MSPAVEKPQAENLQQILVLLDEQEKAHKTGNFRSPRLLRPGDACKPSYMSEAMLPLTQKALNTLPDSNDLTGKVLNGLLGVYDFTSSFKQDLCQGKITSATAISGAKLIAKSAAVVFSMQVAFVSGLAGLVTTGPIGAIAGIGAGAALLVGGTYLAGKAVDLTVGAYRQIMSATRNYIQGQR